MTGPTWSARTPEGTGGGVSPGPDHPAEDGQERQSKQSNRARSRKHPRTGRTKCTDHHGRPRHGQGSSQGNADRPAQCQRDNQAAYLPNLAPMATAVDACRARRRAQPGLGRREVTKRRSCIFAS